jgi:hypothetical protein
MNLKKRETKRLYQSEYTDRLENLADYDVKKNRLLVSIQSPTEYPNYYFRELKNKKLTQLTALKIPSRASRTFTRR